MNQALLPKIGWQILQNDNGIWCHLLKHKYLNNKSFTNLDLSKGIVCSSTWRGVGQGAEFSIKTAFKGYLDAEIMHVWQWHFVWKLKLPPQIQHFLWVLLHGKVLTNKQRCMHGIGFDASCPKCQSGIENIDHLLIRCRDSITVWVDIAKSASSSSSFLGNIDAWLAENLHNNELVNDNVPSFLQFAVVLWFLRKWGCSKVFDANFMFPQSLHLIINSFCKDLVEANFASNSMTVCTISVAWDTPSEGYVKLNVDDGCTGELGSITVGGVLSDHLKSWLRDFVLSRGSRSALEAELQGLFEGLKMAWKKGFSKVVVEIDSMSVIHHIAKATNENHPYSASSRVVSLCSLI
ncbi:hypothetical protein Ddye_000574 [Dipteronia dyeriana]|uniref:Reverse transcriptase zinc-binding domain-containing protein n=1 Tax=Dipteronia dyeriana TaxID=168575 RepID=A0AAD9XMN3_9ROSI|nr:hypothetical protein Ddye_000574 [Dipteronia dyeriana]